METIIILVAIGLAAGALSGFVGLGGGIVLVPALVYFLGMTQHSAQGTALAVMLPPIGILAVMNYYKSGYVDMKSAMIIAGAFILSSYFSSKAALNIPADQIKKVFGGILLVISLKMLLGK